MQPTRVRRAVVYAPERRGFLKRAFALAGGAAVVAAPRAARAGTQSAIPFVGEIMMTAAFYAPDGWFLCDGRLLSIWSYQDLWSIIGTTYGGDGKETFAIPDLRGRAPIHYGQGLGLTNRGLGEAGGTEAEALPVTRLPAHEHAAVAGTAPGTSDIPTGLYPAQDAAGNLHYALSSADVLLEGTTSQSGGNQPHTNLQPMLGINFCICWSGIYPSRP